MTGTLVSELSGYTLSPLREGDLPLYRGCGKGLAPVLLVAAEETSLACLERLEHEYALRAELEGAWAARPLALTRYRGRLTLVLEDPGGEPLDRRLGRALDIREFLQIAIALAGALRQVHARGLIHKDIKPANVLVSADSGGVWLTGFGIAVHVPRERQNPEEAPEVIAGTLAYMAPEQTGRMNRSIDARSDLYSLGVTFYEMLTGTLPFSAADPMEWVHCHIARQPTPPNERAPMPGAIAGIVMKLLAKIAEERYQTAAGVEADLRKCLAAWESGAAIESFPLATQDAPERLLIPERLYGRESEIAALLASFDSVVARGTPELVLVSGYAGIGKSSVVHELHKALVPTRGLFASGKFDQYQRDIPYSTLAQAFKSLVRALLAQSEAQLRPWREALRAALGSGGQLMVNLIPELELVLGPQRPVADLPPQEAQNRFRQVFGDFLGVFARREHPLVLFLDDLQWLDAATLDLLEHCMTHAQVRHLLLVGAYRDNEVDRAHPLMHTLQAIRTSGARVHQIVLTPLALADVGRLVADTLHCEPERGRPLAQLLHEKTGGNPFFAIQFFSALAEERLLAFDSGARVWHWDIVRIRTRNYSDNVVDLMAERLQRLSATTQEALRQFACLGNVAATNMLTCVLGQAEATIHAALREAVEAGLVVRIDGAYKFLHDRIQQAAYSTIPREKRAEVHLALGRALRARFQPNELAEHLFDVASQLNRGAARLLERAEKAQIALINLQAGRKAKASAAYASAGAYFSAGMALVDDSDWASRYELTFGLGLERAECAFLSGHFEQAEHLIEELLARAASKVDRAAVYQVKILLHTVKSENTHAVTSALACLRLFDIDVPPHPAWEQVQCEYEMVWQTLNGHPIESLIDLPGMTDPERQATMQVLSTLLGPAYFTDFNLFCLLVCRMVNLSEQHGACGASAHGCAYLGCILGPVFHRYDEGYRFVKLACDLVEKHGFIAYQAKAHHSMGIVAVWTQSITTAIESNRAAIRTATETGDLTSACYSMSEIIQTLLVRNDPLDAVWRESERNLEFVRKYGFRDMADGIVSQQRLIATMQGRTASLSSFSDAQFDEVTFEAQLTADHTTMVICLYWFVKLKARFLSGDYAEALEAANKAEALIWSAAAHIHLLDYFYYTALTVAALYDDAAADQRARWRELLITHREQLREWTDNHPPTFGDKHALVSAEIARLEGRDPEAMRLYEEAIRSAHDNGFGQNEGVANEVAARFYAARGFETIAHAYLRNARLCYLRWGASGKVRQLDERYSWPREESAQCTPTATIGAGVGQLDLQTVVKASQAVSGEIELGKLTETLLRIAVEHAGAERGVLILCSADELQIEAEATTGHGVVEVRLRHAAVAPTELPESVLHTATRTQQSVILDDATASATFSADVYVQQRRPRSILCLPLVKQAKLVGALYLENNLTPRAFTPGRIAVLELLASQSAISLENAQLYCDLRHENSERKRAQAEVEQAYLRLAEAQRLSKTGSFIIDLLGDEHNWSDEAFRIFELDTGAKITLQEVRDMVHPEDVPSFEAMIGRAMMGADVDFYFRIVTTRGAVKYVRGIARVIEQIAGRPLFIGALQDVTESKVAEEALNAARSELAHVARVTTLNALTASIAHEVSQPLAGIITNAGTCLRMLNSDPPNLDGARETARRITRDGNRASEVISRLRALFSKKEFTLEPLDLNEATREVIALSRSDLQRNRVILRSELADELPPVTGDRIQLEQVILNLVRNASDAMIGVDDRPRALLIKTERDEGDRVRLSVVDAGVGFKPEAANKLFDAFYTTKNNGMGIGLSVSRSIIEAHHGRLSATANHGPGATFSFSIPRTAEPAPAPIHP